MGRFRTQECQPSYYQQDCQPCGDGGSVQNQCCPSNSEMQAFQGCRSRGGCASGSDGFQIVQACQPFENAEAYNSAVSGTFQYTEQNYGQALRDAAAKGQPVIAVFGGANVPNTRGMIEDVKRAQQEGVNATYVYIDMDHLAQNPALNPALAAYTDQNVRGHNLSHAMMFAQKADANGNPIPERNIMSTWGGVAGNVEMFKDQVNYGLEAMKGQKFNIKPSDAGNGAAPSDQAAPKKSTAETFKEVVAGIEAGKKASDWRQGVKDFGQAIKAADRMQPEVNASLEAANKELATAKAAGDVARSAELDAQIAELQKYKDAAWQARMEYGFQMMKWNPAYKGTGEQWLMAAGDRNPGMYESPEFSARMREAGYSTAAELDFAARMQQRDHENQRKKAAVDPNSQTPADNRNSPPDRQQFSQPRAIMRPNPGGPNPGEFAPAVNPPDRQRPPEQRERVRPPEQRERPRPQPENTDWRARLSVAGHGESNSERAQMEYDILAKAADEGKILKTAFGATWCTKWCPPKLGEFERNAKNDSSGQNLYYSNHDFDNSVLAHRLGIPGDNSADSLKPPRNAPKLPNVGSAPQFNDFRVERTSDGAFRLTRINSDKQGGGQTFIIRPKLRKR